MSSITTWQKWYFIMKNKNGYRTKRKESSSNNFLNHAVKYLLIFKCSSQNKEDKVLLNLMITCVRKYYEKANLKIEKKREKGEK